MKHKEKVRIARGMKGGFEGDVWQARKDAIALGIANKIRKIKEAIKNKNEKTSNN